MMPATQIMTWAVLIALVAGTATSTWRGRRGLAIAALTVAASFSIITVPLGEVDIRLEQPLIVAIGVVLLIRDRAAVGRVLRLGAWPITAFGTYLAANAFASVAMAPDPNYSLKLVIWLLLSLSAFGVVAVLVAGQVRPASPDGGYRRWLVIAACIHSLVALAQVAAELGLGSDWGVLRSDASVGKAFGLAWEPNLLAINLAAAAMFVVEPASARSFGGWLRPIQLALAVGIALALSRGGIVALGLGAGVVAFGVYTGSPAGLRKSEWSAFGRSIGLIVAISVAGYLAIATAAASGVGLRPGDVVAPVQPQGTLIPLSPVEPRPTGPAGSPAVGGSPRPSPDATPSPSPSQRPNYVGTGDTVGLRLRNLRTAVLDTMSSAFVGFGPGSFGQRYLEPTCDCPAHIPNQAAATLFESGLIGSISLILGLAWIARRGWQAGGIAHVAALVTLLGGYQFTDALRFGSNWILVGVILGLVVAHRASVEPSPQAPSAIP